MQPVIERGYAAVGLTCPKTDHNVGAVMRAVGVYGASLLAIQGSRFKVFSTDTMKSHRHVPVLHEVDNLHAVIPYGCVPVAVEICDRAQPLHSYKHPERAFYVFGPEDSSLGERTLSWCRDVVYVPTNGCMNLAACVNVVLYDRMAKRALRQS